MVPIHEGKNNISEIKINSHRLLWNEDDKHLKCTSFMIYFAIFKGE